MPVRLMFRRGTPGVDVHTVVPELTKADILFPNILWDGAASVVCNSGLPSVLVGNIALDGSTLHRNQLQVIEASALAIQSICAAGPAACAAFLAATGSSTNSTAEHAAAAATGEPQSPRGRVPLSREATSAALILGQESSGSVRPHSPTDGIASRSLDPVARRPSVLTAGLPVALLEPAEPNPAAAPAAEPRAITAFPAVVALLTVVRRLRHQTEGPRASRIVRLALMALGEAHAAAADLFRCLISTPGGIQPFAGIRACTLHAQATRCLSPDVVRAASLAAESAPAREELVAEGAVALCHRLLRRLRFPTEDADRRLQDACCCLLRPCLALPRAQEESRANETHRLLMEVALAGEEFSVLAGAGPTSASECLVQLAASEEIMVYICTHSALLPIVLLLEEGPSMAARATAAMALADLLLSGEKRDLFR